MRVMLRVSFPVEQGNKAIKDGSLAKTVAAFVERVKPESCYFFPNDGRRSAQFVFDMQDSSQIPPTVEGFIRRSPRGGRADPRHESRGSEEGPPEPAEVGFQGAGCGHREPSRLLKNSHGPRAGGLGCICEARRGGRCAAIVDEPQQSRWPPTPCAITGCRGTAPSAMLSLLDDAQRHRRRRDALHPGPWRWQRDLREFFSSLLGASLRRSAPSLIP